MIKSTSRTSARFRDEVATHSSNFDLSEVIRMADRVQREASQALVRDFSKFRGRIGLYGGSFDPVHLGHLESGLAAKQLLELDALVYLPTPQNPLKQDPLFNTADRVDMLLRTVYPFKDLFVSKFEIDDVCNREGGVIRTIETVERLNAKKDSEASFVLILGADLVFQLPRWERYHELLRAAEVALLGRPLDESTNMFDALSEHYTADERVMLLRNFVPVDLDATYFSTACSTAIREKILAGKGDLVELAPEVVTLTLAKM